MFSSFSLSCWTGGKEVVPEDDEEDVEAEVATSTASMRDGNDKGDHGIGEK